MHMGQFETVLQFSGREQLVFLVLVDGQDVVLSWTGQGHVSFRGGQCHGEGHVFKHVHDLFRLHQRDVDDKVEHFVSAVVDVGHRRGEDFTGRLHWADQVSGAGGNLHEPENPGEGLHGDLIRVEFS